MMAIRLKHGKSLDEQLRIDPVAIGQTIHKIKQEAL